MLKVPLGQVMFLKPNSDQVLRGGITSVDLEQHLLKQNRTHQAALNAIRIISRNCVSVTDVQVCIGSIYAIYFLLRVK